MIFIVILFNIFNSAVSGKIFTSEDVESRIIFGAPAPIKQYPFFARIRNIGEHICGAAIISDRWLLTAAHCIFINNVYIVGGDNKDNNTILASDRVVIHPHYMSNHYVLDNDLALVRVASRIQFSDNVQFIRLPTSCEVKGPLLSIGRGMNEYGKIPSHLMKVDLMEVNVGYCRVAAAQKNNFICATRASGPSANVCGGDSGSPLVSYGDSNATLVGITSFITNHNCVHNKYSAFVRVSQYMPWIQSVMYAYGV